MTKNATRSMSTAKLRIIFYITTLFNQKKVQIQLICLIRPIRPIRLIKKTLLILTFSYFLHRITIPSTDFCDKREQKIAFKRKQ